MLVNKAAIKKLSQCGVYPPRRVCAVFSVVIAYTEIRFHFNPDYSANTAPVFTRFRSFSLNRDF
jgi:hypothetical protein